MTLDLNVWPYFDDYDESKHFHKILFVPGNAVQARELTQIQSMLQQQIQYHGDHIFKNGTVVIPGQVFYDNQVTFVKLETSFDGVNIEQYLDLLLGKRLVGQDSDVEAMVIHAEKATDTDPVTLFVKYVTGNGSVSEFINNEILIEPTSGLTMQIQASNTYTGDASICSINEGVYYVNGFFVGVDTQTIVLNKYDTEPSYVVGLQFNESIITPADDDSLYDNALGFKNLSAPGADRYKITLILEKRPIDYVSSNESEVKFIELLKVINGQVQFLNNETKYAELEKVFARRTYDESGDYIVDDFNFSVREYRSNDRGAWAANTPYIQGDVVSNVVSGTTLYFYARNTGVSGIAAPAPTSKYGTVSDGGILWTQTPTPQINNGLKVDFGSDIDDHIAAEQKVAVVASSGKAYIKGFEVGVQDPQTLIVDKPRDIKHFDNSAIYAPSGSYVLIENITGSLPSISASSIVSGNIIHNDGSTVIGTCWIKNVEVTPTPTQLRMVIFGVKMTDGYDFRFHARKVTSALFNADLVKEDVLMQGNVSTANGTAIDGYGTSFINQIRVGYQIKVIGATSNGGIARVSAASSDVAMTVTPSIGTIAAPGTSFYLRGVNLVQLGSFIAPLSKRYINSVRDSLGNIDTQYLISKPIQTFTTIAGTTVTLSTLGSGETYEPLGHIVFNTTDNLLVGGYTIVSGSGTNSMVLGSLTTGKSYQVIPVVRRSGSLAKEKIKTLATKTITVEEGGGIYDDTIGSHTLITGTSGVLFTNPSIILTEADAVRIIKITMSGGNVGAAYSATGETDITVQYSLDNGQRAEFYDIAKINLKPGYATPTRPIRVTFEYFDHSPGDYFSVDSYSGTPYNQIPSVSFNGTTYNLRDCLDFRSRIADSGTSFTGTGSIISEPIISTSSVIVSYSYYLPRIDMVSLSQSGEFEYVQGISTEVPQTPQISNSAMSLAKLIFSPYLLSPNYAFIQNISHRRYTMKDIARMDMRLQNVEYYVALSELEKKTSLLKIYDENGLERFKNGFVADEFKNQEICDLESHDFQAAVEVSKNEMRPTFETIFASLFEPFGTTESVRKSKGYVVSGPYASLPYTEQTLINQNIASRTEFINPFNVVSFNGSATLTPSGDNWVEVRYVFQETPSINNAAIPTAQTNTNFPSGSGVAQTIFGPDRLTSAQAGGTNNQPTSGTQFSPAPSGTQFSPTPSAGNTTQSNSSVVTRIWTQRDEDLAIAMGHVSNYKVGESYTVSTFFPDAVGGGKNVYGNGSSSTTNSTPVPVTPPVPTMRRRTVVLQLTGMKPNTTLHAFMDDKSIDDIVSACAVFKINNLSGKFNTYKDGTAAPDKMQGARQANGSNSYDLLSRGDIIRAGSASAIVVAAETVFNKTTQANEQVLYVANIKGTFTNSQTIRAGGTQATLVSQSLSNPFQTNSLGNLYAVVTFPAGKYTTGTHYLKFNDTSSGDSFAATTEAKVTYKATMSIDARTVNKDIGPIVITAQKIDPLAQTFVVPKEYTKGVFVTSIDLYFAVALPEDPNSVFLQLVEVINGYPSTTVLAEAEVTPSQIVASKDSSVATTFDFTKNWYGLVYLEPNKEYAIKVLSNSNRYKLWISQIGDKRVDLPTVYVTEQPSTGSLFKSQNNSTWTPEQLQDLKFKVKFAKFDISKSAVVDMFALPLSNTLYDSPNPFKVTHNSSKVRVFHKNHGLAAGFSVTYYLGASATGYSTFNGQTFTVTSVTSPDSYIITLPSPFVDSNIVNSTVPTAYIGGGFVIVDQTFRYETVNFNTTSFMKEGAWINYSMRASNATGKDVVYTAIDPDVNIEMDESKYLFDINNVSIPGDFESLNLKCTMFSTDNNISPILNLEQLSALLISNRINNPSKNDIDTTIDGNKIYNGAITFTNVDASVAYFTVTDSSRFNIGRYLSFLNTANGGGPGANDTTSGQEPKITAIDNSYSPARIYVDKGLSTLSSTNATVTQYDIYVDDIAPIGGSSVAKYQHVPVTLVNQATGLRIILAASVPSDAEFDLYYRTNISSSVSLLQDVKWTIVNMPYKKTVGGEFIEQEITINDVPSFDEFQIKIVMRSTNAAKVPKFKNLRVIALA